MNSSFLLSCRCLLAVVTTISLLLVQPARAQDDEDGLPSNLSRELHPLVLWHRGESPRLRSMNQTDRKAAVSAKLGKNPRRIQTDEGGNVIVRVRLDGTVPAAAVKEQLAALGATVTHEHTAQRADGRDGTLSVHLPVDQAAQAAKTPGVFSVLTAHRPRPRVGRVTSQGAAALSTTAVNNLGYTGKGITVGVISDSYNAATTRSVGAPLLSHALDDVASGDLPGLGNPNGHSQPVVVVQEGSTDPRDGNEDEGRAMLQIIHDMAPDAKLAFSTSGDSQESFAANIRSLRTNPSANCDVLVDDIGFDDEPFFSDGIVAQAVDEVVTSTTLPGRPVIYYSAAGNDGDLSYSSDFTPASEATGLGNLGNINLSSVPSDLRGAGYQNFKGAGTGQGTKIVQKVTVSQADAFINMQWDDPFVSGGLTTGYCLLVFDGSGQFQPDLSGIDNTFQTGEAAQFVYLPLNDDGSDTTYRLVISRRAQGPQTAKHLRYIVEGSGVVIGKYLRTGQPTLFGHSGAAQADGVAAYDTHNIIPLNDGTGAVTGIAAGPEDFESFGPVTVYFDATGNRFPTPQVRQQPTIAAVDGVNTTFFEPGDLADTDPEGDGYPNFYGTSAAAPHAAGVAALLLEAAGGRGSLNSVQMRDLLASTAQDHDLDPAYAIANLASADGKYKISLSAAGDASNNSAFDQEFFTLNYRGPAGSSLRKAAIDLGPAAEVFDASVDNGFPFTIGRATGIPKVDVLAALSDNAVGAANGKLSLVFTAGAFLPGGSLAFGIDRDDRELGRGGNSADLLARGAVTARIIQADGTKLKLTGEFVNQTGHGYSPDVGYGLINAQAALKKLLGQ